MESISKGLSLIPVKKGGVRRAYEQAHAEALTMFEFTCQWKDLSDHFDSVAASLKEQFESLEAREASLEERARIVESKEKELESFLQRVEELEREVHIKEERLATVKQQLEECEKEREGKETQLIFKTESLQNVVNSLDERGRELGFVKQEIAEREKKLLSVEESLKRCCSKLEIKKKELDRVTKSIGECRKLVRIEYEQKTRNEGTAELKRRKMACSVEDRIDEREKGKVEDKVSAELEFKRKELKLSVASWERKLKLNEEKHAEIMKLIRESSIVLHSKQLELSTVRKRLEETSVELELTKGTVAGVNALIGERTRIALMRERDIEERERQFHYQQQLLHQHHLHMARMPVSPWMNGSADSYGSADWQTTAVPHYGSAMPRNFQMP